MAQQKRRTSRRLSGNKSAINKAKEERRQAKFARRAEAGKVYEYKHNPYKKGTDEYRKEQRKRDKKNVDHKTPVARWTSIMNKLDSRLAIEQKERKERKEKLKAGKSKKLVNA